MALRVTQLDHENEQTGSVFSISGPIVIAENMRGSYMYELCRVAYDSLDAKCHTYVSYTVLRHPLVFLAGCKKRSLPPDFDGGFTTKFNKEQMHAFGNLRKLPGPITVIDGRSTKRLDEIISAGSKCISHQVLYSSLVNSNLKVQVRSTSPK